MYVCMYLHLYLHIYICICMYAEAATSSPELAMVKNLQVIRLPKEKGGKTTPVGVSSADGDDVAVRFAILPT